MKIISLCGVGVAAFAIVGCGSSSKPATASGTGQARPEVMDLNDTPPAPIKPAPRTADPIASPSDPAAPAPTAMTTGPRKHTVAAKDTLYSLAKQYYGDSKQWPKIVAANPGLVPEKMPVGKTINIP